MGRSREPSVRLGFTFVSLALFTSSASAGKILNLEEGASCGVVEVCKKISECDTVSKGIGFGHNVVTCGYDKQHLPIVCCSPDVTDRSLPIGPQKRTVSEKMCEKYAEYVFAPARYNPSSVMGSKPVRKGQDMCGRVAVPLIIGGSMAGTREFPHMVQIGYGSGRRPPTSENAWLCGGSLISERYVVSAAHCTYFDTTPTLAPGRKKQYGGRARWARMGMVDTRKRHQSDAPILKIIDWINRTDYTLTGYNDIALFKLERNVALGPNVRPICLHVNEHIDETNAIATGWGKLSDGSNRLNTNILRKVELNLLENEDCDEILKKVLHSERIKDTQLCAGDTEGRDTCQGDSGGPLQVALRHPYCMYSLIGITSGGGKCGSGHPGIYTRVSKYISWIEENVWPDGK